MEVLSVVSHIEQALEQRFSTQTTPRPVFYEKKSTTHNLGLTPFAGLSKG